MPPRLRLISLALVALAGVVGCKPASEPPRAGSGGADAGVTWSTERDVGLAPPSGTIVVDAPPTDIPPLVGELAAPEEIDAGPSEVADTVTTADATPEDAAPTDAEDADTTLPLLPSSIVLPEELVAKVRANPTAREEDDARRFNRSGLQKHRRLELEAAIRDYQQALEAWPGHAFSNYNLACAYALTGHPEDALRHLAILSAIGDDTARSRLLSARTDADFDAMLDDPRFREVTGYAPVYVTWSPGVDRRLDAQRIATALRGVHVAAKATPTEWDTRYTRPTLLVREGDAVAARAAAEVKAAVSLGTIDYIESTAMDPRKVVVLVLPAPGDAPPDEGTGDEGAGDEGVGDASAAVAVRGDARSLSDLIGVRLTARSDGTVQKLLLKPTGFFEWEIATPDGGRTLRRGRYAVKGDALALSYREDVQTPGPDPTTPEVRFEEGKTSTHAFALTPDGLVMEGATFRLQ
ncbi:MAG: hypothetical protein EP329_14115 [Deltaproteobacteria bacterium]|nr:MAG: hypothetical protein EP329_14115 [Deltaproteobacteria bacterium]